MNWTLFGACGGIVTAVGGGLFFLFRKRRGRRRATMALLGYLGRVLEISHPELKRYPTPTVAGRYHTYPLVIECVRKESRCCWRIHSELPQPIDGRLVLHGEERHDKMRELYGVEVVLTGDAAFDQRMLLAAGDEDFARKLFTPYLRSRFVAAPAVALTINCHRQEIYAECTTGMADAKSLIPVVRLLFELCDRLTAAS